MTHSPQVLAVSRYALPDAGVPIFRDPDHDCAAASVPDRRCENRTEFAFSVASSGIR
jgi:hypothetical protein